ncbi:MAG TPA: hypothetical protein VEC12_01770 [Bacteroidia bacterium]|nr:hypothetical protein [Bacteroidia bacterium]
MTQNASHDTLVVHTINHLHGLINENSKNNILNISNQFAGIPQGGFEIHLGSNGKVDFTVAIKTDNTEAVNKIFNAQPKLLKSEGTQGPAGLNSVKNVLNYWFEYDTGTENFNSTPALFLDLHQAHVHILNNANAGIGYWQQHLNNLIAAVGTPHHTQENIAAMQHAISLATGAGYPGYVGIMKSRGDDLRLVVEVLNTCKLVPYIQNMGLSLQPQAESVINELLALSDLADIGFQFENGKALDAYGIGLFISKADGQDMAEQMMLGKLINLGLCSADEAEMILNWNKTSDDFRHKISHFKVSVNKGAITGAKVYLQYNYNKNN